MRNNAEDARVLARNSGLKLALRLATSMLSRRDLAELGRILSERGRAERTEIDIQDALKIVAHHLTPPSMKGQHTDI
ncbi:hypothetical protein [Acetobacter senegalensis]